ncbi:MAG: hypothetical protein NC910_00170 [Candidatus Omnitrophica bacterium]|nr:hypothetical protein [Candidatus Omnitrophota bacterium]
MRRSFLLSVTLLSCTLLTSCGPSYPKERVAQSVVDLCKREYNLDVMCQVQQTTIGVQIVIPGIIAELMKQSAGSGPELPPPLVMEGEYRDNDFNFQFQAKGTFVRAGKEKEREESRPSRDREESKELKALNNVSMVINRVALSTDAKLEFYLLVVRDPLSHLDLIFSGHLGDLKQVQYWAISRGELQKRSRVSMRPPPEEVAAQTVADFLNDLSQETLLQLLERYAAFSTRFGELLPKILQMAVEFQGAQRLLLTEKWPVRQISPDEVLVYVTLEPVRKPGAILFTVQIREGRGYLAGLDRLESGQVPYPYTAFGPPEKWHEAFFLEPIDLAQFLSDQIAKRVLSEFRPYSELVTKEGGGASGRPAPKPATEADVVRTLMETSAYVLNSYRFQEFDAVSVTDVMQGTRWQVSSKELPLYRRSNAPDLQPIP